MHYIFKVIKTSRPVYWFSHFTFFLFGAAHNPSFVLYSPQFFWGMALFSLPFSLFIYAINDYYDWQNDNHNPRKGTILGEKHDSKTLSLTRWWGFGGLAVSLVLACFFGLPAFIALLMLSVVLYAYSAAPWRLKSVPLVDAVAGGGLYFYLIGIIGYAVFSPSNQVLWHLFDGPFILFFLFGMVGQLMGTVLDEVPDRKEGLQTSTTIFGANTVITVCLFFLLVCLYLSRMNLLFTSLFVVLFILCAMAYSTKLRSNLGLQMLGGGYLPVLFFVTTIVLYFVNSAVLKI